VSFTDHDTEALRVNNEQFEMVCEQVDAGDIT